MGREFLRRSGPLHAPQAEFESITRVVRAAHFPANAPVRSRRADTFLEFCGALKRSSCFEMITVLGARSVLKPLPRRLSI